LASISVSPQYIQDNIEEAVSGVKGENSIKIFGRDLDELQRLSKDVKAELSEVRGVREPGVFNLLGQPNLVVRIDRAKPRATAFQSAISMRWCRPPSWARKRHGSMKAR